MPTVLVTIGKWIMTAVGVPLIKWFVADICIPLAKNIYGRVILYNKMKKENEALRIENQRLANEYTQNRTADNFNNLP